MHLTRIAIVAVLALSPLCADAGTVAADETVVPPVPVLSGSRQVHLRDDAGRLAVYTAIPSGSAFASFGGGEASLCSGFAPGDDPATVGVVEAIRPVRSSKWVFIEVPRLDLLAPGEWDLERVWAGVPLESQTRRFAVWCDRVSTDLDLGANLIDLVDVSLLDPLLDPRPRLSVLYNSLQLERLHLFRNPVLEQWGGLVVRHPVWLGVEPSAWRSQSSNPEYYRGMTLYLLALPTALDFTVDFVPDPGAAAAAFSGVVSCVEPGEEWAAAGGSFPAVPSPMGEVAEPGVNGRCSWTPPGPGMVTIQARQTFQIVFWVSGAVAAEPDYVWVSEPESYRVGELRAVNVDG